METENSNFHQKGDWIRYVEVFIAVAGLIVLIFYTTAAYRQASLIQEQSATMSGQLEVMRQQLSEMKSTSEQTERAINTSNRIADAAVQSTAESRRLADTATQATVISNRMADAAAQSVAVSNRLAETAAQTAIESRRLADAAGDANAVSRRLADAAVEATEINRKALDAVQRPFMFVKDVEFVKFVDSLNFHIRIIWENGGNTSTKDLTIENGCLFSDTPVSDPYNTPETTFWGTTSPRQLNKYQMFVGPKQSTYAFGCLMPSFFVAINQTLRNILSDKQHFYLVGKAEYRDTLNPSYLHVTEYCRIVIRLALDDKLSSMTGDTLPCPEHNCADEECKKRELKAASTHSAETK